MLADLGCTLVEVGHSERRRDYGETDDYVAAQVASIRRGGMTAWSASANANRTRCLAR